MIPMLRRHEINDIDWERIKGKLPLRTQEKADHQSQRMMINGMLYKVKTGVPWRDLPECYGTWSTVYSRFRLWSKNDIFKKLFESLAGDADMQNVSIDSTSCKVHQHVAGAKKGLKMPKPIKT